MELLVDFVQQVLLDDGVHHHGDQHVEEKGGEVLEAGIVEREVLENSWLDLNIGCDIVLHDDEDRCEGRGDLEHQTDHEDHGNTGNNVSMVLDDEVMAEEGRVLGFLLHGDGEVMLRCDSSGDNCSALLSLCCGHRWAEVALANCTATPLTPSH